MAEKTFTRLVDDLDDTEIEDGAGQTVAFGLDGTSYEIDLTNDNADELRKAFSRYVSAARKVGGRYVSQRSSGSSGTARSSRSKSDTDPQAVRAWAAANNIEVSARGRIAKSIVDHFRAAGN